MSHWLIEAFIFNRPWYEVLIFTWKVPGLDFIIFLIYMNDKNIYQICEIFFLLWHIQDFYFY